MNKITVPLSDGTGRLERYPLFPSAHVAPRHVDVWLPPGYAAHPEARCPVLYMHDGQNLFDPALAYGGVDWGIDLPGTRRRSANLRPLPRIPGG